MVASLARGCQICRRNSPMKNSKQKSATVATHSRIRVTRRGEIALGPGKAELLAAVGETGSIREAANRMGMSYMRAWSLIRTMNRCFRKPLVAAARGGADGGGAKLTATGRRVLELYQRMEAASVKAMEEDWGALRKLLRE